MQRCFTGAYSGRRECIAHLFDLRLRPGIGRDLTRREKPQCAEQKENGNEATIHVVPVETWGALT